MSRILNLAATLLLYFCVATVMAQTVILGLLWYKGHLAPTRLSEALTVFYGFDSAAAKAMRETRDEREIQVAYADILERRALSSLDLDLRETALDNAMIDLMNQRTRLDDDRKKYTLLLGDFEQRLDELRQGATNRAIQDVQQTLETMRPEQAKAQIVLMMDDERLEDVVTLLKSMPRDVRKRILNEFQEDEKERLYDVLKQILAGTGEGDLIDQVREQIDGFKNS